MSVDLNITDDQFEQEVLNSPVPVLVDFWAPWCGPCRMVSPIVEELANEYGDRVKVVKLNVDENTKTPNEYGVRNIPTLMIFKDKQKVETMVGALPKTTLASNLDKHL
jgi:thioredoxin 1